LCRNLFSAATGARPAEGNAGDRKPLIDQGEREEAAVPGGVPGQPPTAFFPPARTPLPPWGGSRQRTPLAGLGPGGGRESAAVLGKRGCSAEEGGGPACSDQRGRDDVHQIPVEVSSPGQESLVK